VLVSSSRSDSARLAAELNGVIVPRVNADIAALRALHAGDPPAERAEIERLARLWAPLVGLTQGGPLDSGLIGGTVVEHNNALIAQVRRIFIPIEQQAERLIGLETSHSAEVARQSQTTYEDSHTLLIAIATAAILLGAAVMALVIRSVVPRIRRYSDFASRVAAGAATTSVAVSGSDELSDLGGALNEMVRRRVTERARDGAQAEFAEVMQLTESEDEAHDLLKRQIERLIPDSRVVMLNRNNSADRLQATTTVPDDSPLARALLNAKPRSCLAVRFARTHTEQVDGDHLLRCEVCGKSAGFSTCEPLLVGGEVIGSVLATHPRALNDFETQSIGQSVTQAAPVLANLRNLAIAEHQAQTDALTGLPNKRNVSDTVKRMVAYASRSVTPLAAISFDLDHFKQINDTFGHGAGDEALAAVGSVLKTSVRESDFVGRAGGEEFLILLPDTGVAAAQRVAENIRAAVAEITTPLIERPITASMGIAVLPDHAGDWNSLLRHADRALYAAKSNGRNRVETFAGRMLFSDQPPSDTSSDSEPSPLAVNGDQHAQAPER
jgi:diguanylate cyclase (GGDEF)-like protein